jgi:glutamate/aspartate transport system substrate-binding protein
LCEAATGTVAGHWFAQACRIGRRCNAVPPPAEVAVAAKSCVFQTPVLISTAAKSSPAGTGVSYMLRAVIAGIVLLSSAATAWSQEIDSVAKKVREKGTITMGYRETLLPTSYLDENKQPTGYSVEFCHRIIDALKAELKVAEIKVNYIPVNIQTRQALVANGTVDIECGGTVNTLARAKQVDFSPVTYVAASQMLVLKASGINGISDLNGKIVAIATGGSSEPEMKAIVKEHNLTVRILPVDDHAAGLIAVETRRADVYFNDNAAFFSLMKQAKKPETLAIVGPEYGYSPQGFMIPKNNPTLQWVVASTMARMVRNGDAEKLFNKWFNPFGATIGPKLRAAWDTFSYPD